MKKELRIWQILYWIVTGLLIVLGLFIGALWDFKLVGSNAPEVLAHLGYPLYLLIILGVAKVLAAFALIIPGFLLLKEWAYAGIAFIFLGAMASHLLAGDGVEAFIWPMLFASLNFGSYFLRPRNRKSEV